MRFGKTLIPDEWRIADNSIKQGPVGAAPPCEEIARLHNVRSAMTELAPKPLACLVGFIRQYLYAEQVVRPRRSLGSQCRKPVRGCEQEFTIAAARLQDDVVGVPDCPISQPPRQTLRCVVAPAQLVGIEFAETSAVCPFGAACRTSLCGNARQFGHLGCPT